MDTINVVLHTVRINNHIATLIEDGGDIYNETQSSCTHPDDVIEGLAELEVISSQIVAAHRALDILQRLNPLAFELGMDMS